MSGIARIGKRPERGEDRYTVFAEFPGGDVEEIDVDARDRVEARAIARAELDANYEPGGRIKHVEGPRFGLYM